MDILIIGSLYVSMGLAFFVFSKRQKPITKKITSILETASEKYKIPLTYHFHNKSDKLNYEHADKISGNILGKDITISSEMNSINIYFKHTIDINNKGLIKIFKETKEKKIEKALGMKDYIIGDSDFDKAVIVKSYREDVMISLLGKKTRKQLLEISETTTEFEISNSWLKISLQYKKINSFDDLDYYLRLLLSLSAALCDENIKKMLIHNINEETNKIILIKNIHVLGKNYNADIETETVLLYLLNSPLISVKISSAQYLNNKGMKFLTEELNKENQLKPIDKKKIITILAHHKYTKSIKILITIYSKSLKKIKIEILKAFKQFGEKSLTPFLIERLDEKDTDILLHAVKSLSTCGTVSSVEKLLHIFGKNRNRLINNEIQSSIAMIQSRLGEVEKGWLSSPEMDNTKGALSFPKNNSGFLSLGSKLILGVSAKKYY